VAERASTELRKREEAVGIYWEFLRLFGGSMGFLEDD
jgi:hypothetical protein